MKGGTFFDVGDAERARILDVARRLGSVRWPATAVVTAAVASAATVAGAAVILPVLLYLCLLPLLSRLGRECEYPEQVLFGELVNGGTVTVAVVGEGDDAKLELVAVPPRPAKPKAIAAPRKRKPKAAEEKS